MDVTDTTSGRPESRSSVVAAYYRNIDRKNIKAALSCYSPDAVYLRPGYNAFVGLQAIDTFYREERAIAGGRHELQAVIEEGNVVAVQGKFNGTLRSGAPTQVRFADFWRFSDLMVVERHTYFAVAGI